MTAIEPDRVLTSAQARNSLGPILADFRADASARPVIFGAHRRPEAVVIPFVQYEQMLNRLEDAEIAVTVRKRLAAGEAEAIELDELFARVGLGQADA